MLTEDFNDAIKSCVGTDKIDGLHLAIATGEVLEEDESFIEVLILGKSFYAKPCMSFGSYCVPNKEWLKKYKDEIMVWVAFENSNPAHAVYLGVCPMDNKTPPKDFEYTKRWKSVEFEYIFDDKNKLFKVEHIGGSFLSINGKNGEIECKSKDGQGWVANTNTIIGGGRGLKSALLGETMLDLFDNVITTIMGATIPTPLGGVGTLDPVTISKLVMVKAQLKTALSIKVKLD